MLVRVYSKLPEGSKSFAKTKRRIGVFTCDQCSKEFERWVQLKKMLDKEIHFCGLPCVYAARKKGGIIDRKFVATHLERYGVECYVLARPERAREMVRRSHLPAAKEKRRRTMLERYGIVSPFERPEVQAKARANSNCHSTKACEKRWRTIRHNSKGRGFSSVIEDRMAGLLIARYGVDAIERHSTNLSEDKRKSIDFHIKPLDFYIQVDGVYWHGLDRPFEEVMARSGKHGDIIRGKWLRDRLLDEQCRNKSIRLVRITDQEMNDPSWSFERWIEDLEQHTELISEVL